MAREPLRVLVVEDQEPLAETFAESIRRSGHLAYVAHTGSSAVAMAQSHAPHAVLLDIGLPDMDGYDVARTIRERELGKRTVIVVVTGKTVDQDDHAHVDLVLRKPVETELLTGLVEYLSRQRLRAPS